MIISLGGLWMVHNQALRSMALGAMIVVAIAILVATTLLPALIRILGHRVEAGGIAWTVLRGRAAPVAQAPAPRLDQARSRDLLAALDLRRDAPAGRLGRRRERRCC